MGTMVGDHLREEIDEGPPGWEPPGWLVPAAVLALALVGLIVVVVPPAWRALAPVVVAQESLGEVFRPRLVTGGASWAWPREESPKAIGPRFCDDALARAFDERVWIAESERGSGLVYAGTHRGSAEASAAFEEVARRYATCATDRFQVVDTGQRSVRGVALHAYQVEALSPCRFQTLRREVCFVAFGNTVAAFVGSDLPADEVLADGYRAGVRRAAGR